MGLSPVYIKVFIKVTASNMGDKMGKVDIKWLLLNSDGGYDRVDFITVRLSKLHSVRCASLMREGVDTYAWFKNGQLHRYYGPAIKDESYVWYVGGYRIKEHEDID